MIRAQHQRLVPMLLSSQGAGHILTALHDFSALVVDAQDAGHTVAAGAALECRRNGFIIGNGTGAGSCPGREARYKGLLFHSRLRLQRTGDPMQVPHLIPLIC